MSKAQLHGGTTLPTRHSKTTGSKSHYRSVYQLLLNISLTCFTSSCWRSKLLGSLVLQHRSIRLCSCCNTTAPNINPMLVNIRLACLYIAKQCLFDGCSALAPDQLRSYCMHLCQIASKLHSPSRIKLCTTGYVSLVNRELQRIVFIRVSQQECDMFSS